MIAPGKTLLLLWLTLCVAICAWPLDARAQTTVQMTKAGGVYMMPCKVNGLALRFIIDTGASDVSISATEALFMLKNGYLDQSDFIGEESFQLANGQTMKGSAVVFRQLEIGGIVLHNVKASVSHTIGAPLLLGQSALRQLGTVSFDYANDTVTFGGGVATYNDGEVSFTGPFDGVKALRALYGDGQLADGEWIVWQASNPPPDKEKELRQRRFGNRDKAHVAFESTYQEEGVQKRVIITETIPDDGSDYGCHACVPLVGGAVFRHSSNGWVLESQNKYIGFYGSFGTIIGIDAGNIKLILVGPSRYGVVLHIVDMGFGVKYESVILLVSHQGLLQEAGLSLGPFGGDMIAQDINVKAMPSQPMVERYYRLEALFTLVSESDAYAQANSGTRKTKPVAGKKYFQFKDGRYVESK